MGEVKARRHEVQVRFVRTEACNPREVPGDERSGLGAEERLHLARIRRVEERREQAMRTLTAGSGVDHLASLWALKEAIAKAAHQGSSSAQASVEVGGASSWRVAVWRLTPDHFASVALPGQEGEEDQVMHCEEDSPWAVPPSELAARKRA
jgi:hypothetical protein